MLQGAVIGTTMAIVALLKHVGNREVTAKSDGSRQLWLSTGIAILGWVCTLIGLLFLLSPTLVDEEGLWKIATPTGIVFSGMGIWVLLTYYNHTLRFDARQVWITDEWGREEVFYFSEVKHAGIHKRSGNLRVVITDGRTVEVSPYLKGYATFEATLRRFIVQQY